MSEKPLIITIDRVSDSRNLIARSDCSKHILPEKVEGQLPQPGEKWRVKRVRHTHHPIALEPQEHIETIDDYTPLYEGSGKEPKKTEGYKRSNSKPEKDFSIGDFELQKSGHKNKKTGGPAGTTVRGHTSSKNGLLKGIR